MCIKKQMPFSRPTMSSPWHQVVGLRASRAARSAAAALWRWSDFDETAGGTQSAKAPQGMWNRFVPDLMLVLADTFWDLNLFPKHVLWWCSARKLFRFGVGFIFNLRVRRWRIRFNSSRSVQQMWLRLNTVIANNGGCLMSSIDCWRKKSALRDAHAALFTNLWVHIRATLHISGRLKRQRGSGLGCDSMLLQMIITAVSECSSLNIKVIQSLQLLAFGSCWMEAVEMQAGWGLLPPCHEIKGSITLHLLSIPFQDIVDICWYWTSSSWKFKNRWPCIMVLFPFCSWSCQLHRKALALGAVRISMQALIGHWSDGDGRSLHGLGD